MAATTVDQRAADALCAYGGCGTERAESLVKALRATAADEALRVAAGELQVLNSQTDTRVERLRALVAQLAQQAETEKNAGTDPAPSLPIPTQFELSTVWRITPSQALSVLRTWRARYPEHYEQRMKATVATGKTSDAGEVGKETWVVELDDPSAIDYAAELARRRGLSKGLKVNRVALTIAAPQTSTTADGKDLPTLLGVSGK